MSIQKFYSAAVANDFARTFQYRVDNISIGGPNYPIDWSYEDGGETLYVETANLPGRIVNNIPVPFMGLQFNVPGAASFPGSANYAVRFRCDQAYAIRSQLERALVDIFSINETAGNYNTPGKANTLTFTLFNKLAGQGTMPTPIRTYTLVGVYVQALGDTLYDVKDNGTVAMIDCTLAYQYWLAGANESPGGIDLPASQNAFDKGTRDLSDSATGV